MNEEIPSFIKLEGEKLIFQGEGKELVAYIPEKYFERKLAEVEGDYINLVGIFNYTVQSKNGRNIGLHNFIYPTYVTTRPGSVEKVKDIRLIKNSDPEDYRILRYKPGDIVINSTKTTKFVGNVEKVMNLFFILGYIPNTIPYDKLGDIMFESMDIFGDSFGVNAQVMGIALSEVCRDKNDPNKPFRLSKSNDMHDYKSMSIRNVSKLISPYTALISEDFDESILYAMMNENPKDTPLEKVLVGTDNT